MTYEVRVEETLYARFYVEADNEREAIEKAYDPPEDVKWSVDEYAITEINRCE